MYKHIEDVYPRPVTTQQTASTTSQPLPDNVPTGDKQAAPGSKAADGKQRVQLR